MLEALGLPEAASRIYVFALKNPGQTVSAIGSSLALHDSDVLAGWSELVRYGISTENSEGSVFVVPPPAVYDVIIRRQEVEQVAASARVENTRKFIEEITVPTKERSVVILGEGVPGDFITKRLEELSAGAKSSVLSFAPGGAQRPQDIAEGRARNAEMLERGVVSRAIYLSTALKDAPTLENLRWLSELGAEVRTVATLPTRMIIIDEKVAVLPADKMHGWLGAIIISNPSIIAVLKKIFEYVWATAKPIGSEYQSHNIGDLSDEERTVLELIALGHTDDQIANATGLSSRMVRRQADSFKAKLKAPSRTAIGYLAAKKAGCKIQLDSNMRNLRFSLEF